MYSNETLRWFGMQVLHRMIVIYRRKKIYAAFVLDYYLSTQASTNDDGSVGCTGDADCLAISAHGHCVDNRCVCVKGCVFFEDVGRGVKLSMKSCDKLYAKVSKRARNASTMPSLYFVRKTRPKQTLSNWYIAYSWLTDVYVKCYHQLHRLSSTLVACRT